MGYFQIANLVLLGLFILLLLRYLWSMFFTDESYMPEQWKFAVKNKTVKREIIELEKNYSDKVRFFNFWFQIERIKKENIPGAFAELGVYKGETAKIFHLIDDSRNLHLFDTFEGFRKEDLKIETGEAATYKTKNFADTSLIKVKEYISGNENVIYHQGYFPDTASDMEDEVFSFVNMDADLHNPTKAGLEFFYPRLSPGGVILIHDYNNKWEGLIKAVDEFVKTIPESLVEIPDMYGTVMIVKAKF